jgi:hypothetical protein
LAEN